MVKEAEANAAEDKKRKELVEAKNHAEAMIHSTTKSMKEFGEKIAAADKSAIDAAIAELKSVMEGEDAAAITAKTNALAQVAMKLGEAMYKAQSGAGAGGADGDAGEPQGPGEDDIVDADFEEVRDDDKRV